MRNAAYLKIQAGKCRELARDTDDKKAKAALLKLAEEYDAEAKGLAQAEKGPVTPRK
jgi:hypothetical protein